MSDQVKTGKISARAELYRLTRQLRQYLRWQRASGAVGSVPADKDARAAFETAKKARDQAKLERLKRGLGLGAGATKEAEASPARPPSQMPQKPRKRPPQRGARHHVEAPQKSAGLAPWKTGGSRPTRRFYGDQAPPEETPGQKNPRREDAPRPAAAQQDSARSAQDAAMDAYAAQSGGAAEIPEDYHPGAQLYDKPPTPAAKKPAEMSKAEKLVFLREYMGDCRRCGLCEGRNQLVFGQGNPDAELVFVLPAPDASDDKSAKLLSDPRIAGEDNGLFIKMLAAMGLGLDEVYLSTVVKCRPPNDRAPQAAEISECAPFLYKQLSVIEPKVIVTLGESAAALLIENAPPKRADPRQFSANIRGVWATWRGISLMPTFHPAALLEAQGAEQRRLKAQTWQDLQQVMRKLGLSPR